MNYTRWIHDTVRNPTSNQLAISNKNAFILAKFIKCMNTYEGKFRDMNSRNKWNKHWAFTEYRILIALEYQKV